MFFVRTTVALLVFLFFWIRPVVAQQPTAPAQSGEIFTVVEKQPEFPDGMKAMRAYIDKHLVYPEEARKAGITGTVFVAFVINADGSIQDAQVLKGIGYGCDEQAVQLILGMPHWIPGRQQGKAVRVKYNLPIRFGIRN